MPCPVCGNPSKNNQLCGSQTCREFVQKALVDPIFFFENFLIIRYIKGRPQFFTLFEWQREFLIYCKEQLDKGESIRALVQKGRRIGFSALVAGFHIWYVVCRSGYDGEDKYWDIISASHQQAKKLFRSGKRMIKWNPLLMNAVKREKNGVERLTETQVIFNNPEETIEGVINALSSGGATKRGRDPSGQTFDEAAQIADPDYNDLDISSMAGDDHQIIGSTPYDDYGFFYDIVQQSSGEDPDECEYRIFNVPTAVLTPEGMDLLEVGEIHKIKEEHIAKVNGWRVTPKKIVQRLKRYDLITAKREIFGLFVSGLELYYPGALVKPCIDYERELFDLVYDPKNYSNEVLRMFPDTIGINIGEDMAGRGHDKTYVTVFAMQPEGQAHMVYYESWNRMKYTNQYEEIVRISKAFENSKWGVPRHFVDITGTQDSNMDSLQALGLDVTGIDFSPKRKKAMAQILFEYFMRGKETNGEYFSLMHEEGMYREILSVRADFKGEGGHLGDSVASIWCALSEMTDFSGATEVEYDYDAPLSDSARVNSGF